ncbi:FMN-binding protein [Actinoplanes sp. NPDC049265]|uniref:FMN-binding protein n=1 Tax=Actinoplanes sp. NPDC049265 TaxID=3363902 RepID=UPI00371B6349
MRRSTAAAVGTLTGAALIVGVRLSVSAPEAPAAAPPPAAPAANEQPASNGAAGAAAKPSTKPPASSSDKSDTPPADEGKFKNGTYKADAKYVYGTISLSLKVTGGKIASVEAGYPTANDSGTINPPAIQALKAATLKAQSAEVDAVSGATLTSEAYLKGLQAALDKAAK